MGPGSAGAQRLSGRAGQGAAAARGGRQGDPPGHGCQDQGQCHSRIIHRWMEGCNVTFCPS